MESTNAQSVRQSEGEEVTGEERREEERQKEEKEDRKTAIVEKET